MKQISKLKWRKLGPILSIENIGLPDWMETYVQAPNAIYLDKKIRVFFSSRRNPDSFGQYESRVGWADFSSDGKFDLLGISKEPILELGTPGSFDQHGTYPLSVYKTSESELLGVYAGWQRSSAVPFDVSLGLAVSIDLGNTFKKFSVGPIVTKSLFEPFIISSPKLWFYEGVLHLF